jgi:hypothetical protein
MWWLCGRSSAFRAGRKSRETFWPPSGYLSVQSSSRLVLEVFPQCPGTSLSVQICWPDDIECPPTSTDVLSRLYWWLDSWLDLGSFQGQVTVEFREADGEELDLCMGASLRLTSCTLCKGSDF